MKRMIVLLIMLLLNIPAQAEALDDLWQQLPAAELQEAAQQSGVDFAQMVKSLLSGEGNFGEWADKIVRSARDAVQTHWMSMAGVLMFACIGEMARAFSGGNQARRALELLCRMAAGLVLIDLFLQIDAETAKVCARLRSFAGTAAPVLAAALTLTGSAGMAAAITPAAALADQAAVCLTTDVGLVLLRIAAALAVFSGIGSRFRLERMFKLCISIVKWLLGCCMTGFLALMSARTLLTGGKDGVAVQTARYAVDNLLPIIGGELADTVSSVFASTVLLKNAVGVAVCAVLIAMSLAPIARLAAIVLMMKIASAAADMLSAQGASSMMDRFCQVLEAMMAILAAVAALGMILAGAVVMTVAAKGG